MQNCALKRKTPFRFAFILIQIPVILMVRMHGLYVYEEDKIYTLHNCRKDNLFQFPDVTVITELRLQNCFIPILVNGMFANFNNLKLLEISDSHLATLDEHALQGLMHLHFLSLARNNLSEVKSWSNEQISSLTHLDLSGNVVRNLSSNSFYRYPNLQHLNIAANLLVDIESDIFDRMPMLKHLNLAQNHLLAIEKTDFYGMSRITHLLLQENAIEFIESEAFFTNAQLRVLRLDGNKLRQVGFLQNRNFHRLLHLNLSHNTIETVDEMQFLDDSDLNELDLSYNRLMKIKAENFKGLQNLELLNISNNFLQRINVDTFQMLISLKYVHLNNNNITQLHVNTFNIRTHSLRYINLSHNQLRSVDAALFNNLSNLDFLDLSGNQLQQHEFIDSLANIMKHNRLTLNLSDNGFRSLNMTSLKAYEQVELSNNRWSCKWLIKEMLRKPKSINFGQPLEVYAAWSVNMLQINAMECYDENTKRNIIILDLTEAQERRSKVTKCETGKTNQLNKHQGSKVDPTADPTLVWPTIKTDKLDSRSVVIWMLIAITLAFSALRVARKLVDRKEQQIKLQRLIAKYKAQHEAQTHLYSEEIEKLNKNVRKNSK
uniref:Uncharacterized protein n=1 Tax=Glossina brevipalpis TaxID=37001 RepID=A0A1A9W6S5_9MUSC